MVPVVLRSWWVVVAVLALCCSALEDEPDMTQREVTFDLSEFFGGKAASQLDPDMTQREIDPSALWEPIELPDVDPDMTQREVTFDLPKILRERGSRRDGPDMTQREMTLDLDGGFDDVAAGPPVLRPRSFSDLPFPPGRPSPSSLPAICNYGDMRPRYPPHPLPQTGFSYLSRQWGTIKRVESWYSVCCQRNGTQDQDFPLCCARQAWEKALNLFCEEEFSIKTRHYHCCKKQGAARWSCFENEAPNPSYKPTVTGVALLPSPPVPGFTMNRSACQSKNSTSSQAGMGPRSSKIAKQTDISFPPGRPTVYNIKWVCEFRKFRPRYLQKCLPPNGYGWLARQAKAVNRMEKGIKQCCKGKKEVLSCANRKWQDVMDKYCKEEHSVKAPRFPCCELPEGQERYNCFSTRAPKSDYRPEMLSREVEVVFPTVGMVCDTHKLLTKKFSVPLPIKSLVSHCCHLRVAQRTACVTKKLNDVLESMCTAEPGSPVITPDCCTQTSRNPHNCLSGLLENAIGKVTKSVEFQRQRCPLV